MLIKFRFIEPLSAVTPVFNALLTAGDKITDVFSKLQGLLAVRKRRAVITNAVTAGASSTADIVMASLVIPANEIVTGDIVRFFLLGDWNKPNSGTNTVRLWVKVNGVLAGQISYATTSNVGDQPIRFDGYLTIRGLSASAQVVGGLSAVIARTATAYDVRSTQGNIAVVNTLADITVTVGIGFGSSNASNRVTAEILNIVKE